MVAVWSLPASSENLPARWYCSSPFLETVVIYSMCPVFTIMQLGVKMQTCYILGQFTGRHPLSLYSSTTHHSALQRYEWSVTSNKRNRRKNKKRKLYDVLNYTLYLPFPAAKTDSYLHAKNRAYPPGILTFPILQPFWHFCTEFPLLIL